MFAFSLVSCNCPPYLFGAQFGPCAVKASVWGHLVLVVGWYRVVRPDACPQPISPVHSYMELQCCVMVPPERFLLLDRAGSQIRCLLPVHLLGLQSNWCVWLYSLFLRAGVTLEWYWSLPRLLAGRNRAGATLKGLLPSRAGWMEQICRKMLLCGAQS